MEIFFAINRVFFNPYLEKTTALAPWQPAASANAKKLKKKETHRSFL